MSMIADALRAQEIEIDKEAAKKLFKFCELLKSWNKTHSLTSLRTDEEYTEAIVDSVYPLKFLSDFKSALDIGSGAGFPAFALAILKKNAHFTLCEPLVKKYAFLQFAKIELGLANVTVKKNRVEELQADEFELITSRAVANSQILVDLSSRLLKEDGYWLFYKGDLSEREIRGENVCVYSREKRRYVLIHKEKEHC